MNTATAKALSDRFTNGAEQELVMPSTNFPSAVLTSDFGLQGLFPMQGFVLSGNNFQINAQQMLPISSSSDNFRNIFITRKSGADPFDVSVTLMDGITIHPTISFDITTFGSSSNIMVTVSAQDDNPGLLSIFNPDGFYAALITLQPRKYTSIKMQGFILTDVTLPSLTPPFIMPITPTMGIGQFQSLVDLVNAVWFGQANIEAFNLGCGIAPFFFNGRNSIDAREVLHLFDSLASQIPAARSIFLSPTGITLRGQSVNGATDTNKSKPINTVMAISRIPPFNTIAHEIGHTFGLEDFNSDPFNIMFGDGQKNGLGANIIQVGGLII